MKTAAPATAQWLWPGRAGGAAPVVEATALGAFLLLGAAVALLAPFPLGFDEAAHLSYVLHLAETGRFWPDFESMELLEPGSAGGATLNYLNHPPGHYWMLAQLVRSGLLGGDGLVLGLRLLDLSLSGAGAAVLLSLGPALPWPRPARLLYATLVVGTPMLPVLGGLVTNDDLAFLGGALAFRGAADLLLRSGGSRGAGWRAWVMTGSGVAAASAAKLPAAIGTWAFLLAVLVILCRRNGSAPILRLVPLAALGLAAAAVIPYLVYWVAHGSPAPMTPGHAAVLLDRLDGASLPAVGGDVWSFAQHFVSSLVMFWPPALPRTPFEAQMLILPLMGLALGLLGVAASGLRMARGCADPLDRLSFAGSAALLTLGAVHFAYTYSRFLETGWLKGLYPRYYFPLLAVLPAAAGSFVARLEPRAGTALAAVVGTGTLGYLGFALAVMVQRVGLWSP